MIPVQLLHNPTQTLMTIILLIPHILFKISYQPSLFFFPPMHSGAIPTYLVIPYLAFLIKRQSDQAIHFLANGYRSWSILLLQLEYDLIWL